jgi:hypothetical protein
VPHRPGRRPRHGSFPVLDRHPILDLGPHHSPNPPTTAVVSISRVRPGTPPRPLAIPGSPKANPDSAPAATRTRRSSAGIGTNSFYELFPNKEAVMIGLYDRLGDDLRQAVSAQHVAHRFDADPCAP